MPALRVFGEDPLRDPNDGLLFSRVPIAVLEDRRLSSGAKTQLGLILPTKGQLPNFVTVSDKSIHSVTGWAISTVQTHWIELEQAGWLRRERRSNVRRIYLVFDLAGQSMQSQKTGSAITENRKCTYKIFSVQSQKNGSPNTREGEKRELTEGRTSATQPQEGVSPTSRPVRREELPAPLDDSEREGLRQLVADGPAPIATMALNLLADDRSADLVRTGKVGRKSDLPGPTMEDLLTEQQRLDARRVLADPSSHELAAAVAAISLTLDRKARECLEKKIPLPEKRGRTADRLHPGPAVLPELDAQNCTENAQPGQYKGDPIEHKTH